MKTTLNFIKRSSFFLFLSFYGCFGGGDELDVDEVITNDEINENDNSNLNENNNQNMNNDVNIDEEIEEEEPPNEMDSNPMGDLDQVQQNILENEANIPLDDTPLDSQQGLNNNFTFEAESMDVNAPQMLENNTVMVEEAIPETSIPIDVNTILEERSLYYVINRTTSYTDTTGAAVAGNYEQGDPIMVIIEGNWGKIGDKNFIGADQLSKDYIPRTRDENPWR